MMGRPDKPESSGKRANWVVGWIILLIATFVLWPMIQRQRKAADRTKAIGHCKQIGLALLEFDQEYGVLPNESTAPLVKKSTETSMDLSGSSSNALFRQFIAFGIRSEIIFYCVHPEGIRMPDQDMSPGKALEAGEVGYSYLCGLNTKMNPGTPVITAPMKIGTKTYWLEPYGGRAVVLHLDNSVNTPLIRDSDGEIPVADGKTLFDPGPNTFWDDSMKPRAVWPKDYVVDLRHPEK